VFATSVHIIYDIICDIFYIIYDIEGLYDITS